MFVTVTAGIVAAGLIEIGGLPAMLALLVPVVVLVIVIVRVYRRQPPPVSRPKPEADVLRTVPDGSAARPAVDHEAETAIGKPEPVDWVLRIRSAEAGNDPSAVAELYLSFARSEIAAGRRGTAAEHLRASVGAAARSRNASVQAQARLELAELAREAGDLTTACEHWQIARALFHDLKREAERAETESLMLKHGCPTDWVLNDF